MSSNKVIHIYNASANNTRHECFAFNSLEEQELIISLFTECNLACNFCGDRARSYEKLSKAGLIHRLNLLDKIIDSKVLDKCKIIRIKLFGGELFQDKFDDAVFDWYDEFINAVEKKLYNKAVLWSISTNFVFKKSQRVFSWLKKRNIDLRCSFDFSGRFTKDWQLNCFLKNLEDAKVLGLNPKIAIVLTKVAISSIYNKTGLFDVFKHLYENYSISFDYYDDISLIPKDKGISKNIKNPKELNLTEKDIGEFFLYALSNYACISNVKNIVNSLDSKSLHCSHGLTITDKIYWECCNMDEVYKTLMKNKQCIICKHYPYCIGMCNRIFYNETYCHLKTVYDAIAK